MTGFFHDHKCKVTNAMLCSFSNSLRIHHVPTLMLAADNMSDQVIANVACWHALLFDVFNSLRHGALTLSPTSLASAVGACARPLALKDPRLREHLLRLRRDGGLGREAPPEPSGTSPSNA